MGGEEGKGEGQEEGLTKPEMGGLKGLFVAEEVGIFEGEIEVVHGGKH